MPGDGQVHVATTRPDCQKPTHFSTKPSSGQQDVKRSSWCSCDEDSPSIHSKESPPSPTDVEAQYALSEPIGLSKEKERSILPIDNNQNKGVAAAPDPFKVAFEGPNDPLDPKNWPTNQKWATTACIAAFTFLSPLTSTMVAPALGQISQDFGITHAIESKIILSIFVLAFAVGPMLLGPLSELHGRVLVSQCSNVFFLIFNTLCGFAQTKEQLMAFRFLAGLGGSAPLAIGGSILGDLFHPEERGKAMGVFSMGPLLGPAIGPIIGGWITEKSTWRWLFWAVSIANCFILGAGLIWFQESYAPVILHKKAKSMRRSTGNPAYRAEGENDVDQRLWTKVSSTMGRSFTMLATQPIVQVMSLYMGFSYGLLYLMLSTYTDLFLIRYKQSVGIAGLNFISLGLGFFLGAPLCGKTCDVVYRKMKARDPHRRGKPEFRMPVILPFSSLVPVGILIYGWSAQATTHWIVPNIGAFIFGIGTIAAFHCVTTYLVDAYARFAASAVAAVTILRSLMGFCFPIFAPAMYSTLGYGWGNSVLALAALIIGMPVPILLWIYGEKLRKKSFMTAKPGGPGGRGPAPNPGPCATTNDPKGGGVLVAQQAVATEQVPMAPSPMIRPSAAALSKPL